MVLFRKVLIIIFLILQILPAQSIDSMMFHHQNIFYSKHVKAVVGSRLKLLYPELNEMLLQWHYVCVPENEFTTVDTNFHYLFFGTFDSYTTLNKWLPSTFLSTKDGFLFKGEKFSDSLDALHLFTSDGNFCFTLGNSISAIKSQFSTFITISQFNIMRNYRIAYHGFLNNDNSLDSNHFYDCRALQSKQLKQYNSRYYEFYIDPALLTGEVNVDSLRSSEDKKYLDIVKICQVPISQTRIKCYVYKDFAQKYFLSATPGSGNPFEKAMESHNVGFSSVQHESIHLLAGEMSTFLAEGLMGYFYTKTDTKEWTRIRNLFDKPEDPDFERYLYKGDFDFTSEAYGSAAYFTRFLIDTYGLSKFKSASKYIFFTDAIKPVYNTTKEKLYRKWSTYFKKTCIPSGPACDLTIRVETKNLNPGEKIYITGEQPELSRWKPDGIVLDSVSQGFEKKFKFRKGKTISFKITRGSWSSEALDEEGKIPGNTILSITGDMVKTIQVNSWKDRK
ncbi:MAG: hypothetical protein LWX56_14995 [Ignavibacteria bacterium]|nr:hypothetical protein [Ignavibacteria bacterium]